MPCRLPPVAAVDCYIWPCTERVQEMSVRTTTIGFNSTSSWLIACQLQSMKPFHRSKHYWQHFDPESSSIVNIYELSSFINVSRLIHGFAHQDKLMAELILQPARWSLGPPRMLKFQGWPPLSSQCKPFQIATQDVDMPNASLGESFLEGNHDVLNGSLSFLDAKSVLLSNH